MKIIESKIVGKKSQESCEDGMVITDDFIAVIDGSTSKTPKHLNPDMKNGRYAMMLISEYIREELKADASVDDFCQGVSAYIYNKVYEKLGVEKRLKEHPEERLTASAILYSRTRNEVWMVGDCQAIIDGKLYKGKSGFSGEFGHNFGYENEIICHCGKKGCIETEVSGAALHRILLEHINNGENSIISNTKKNLEDLTLDDIIDAVNKEDLLCIELVEEIGVKLGRHVAGLINIFNPELVIIGGALSRTGDYLTQPITTAIRKYTLNLMNRDSVIVESKLKERAGIIGACMLSRSKLFE